MILGMGHEEVAPHGLEVALAPLVCVVDDDASIRRVLRRILAAAGFRVETFASAEEYLESEHRADCLVLDVHLGGLSGLDLHERLTASGARTPAVVITAHDTPPTRERARQAEVEYLPKPFDRDSLIAAIRRAIGDR